MILRSGLKGGGNGQAGFSLPGFGAGSPMLLVRLLFFHFELGCSLTTGSCSQGAGGLFRGCRSPSILGCSHEVLSSLRNCRVEFSHTSDSAIAAQ